MLSKLLLVLGDAVALLGAMLAAIALSSLSANPAVDQDQHKHIVLAVASLPGWITLLSANKLYAFRYMTRRAEEVRRVVRAALTGTVLMTFATVVFKLGNTRSWVFSLALCSCLGLILARVIARQLFNRARKQGNLLRAVVVVGGNLEALEICQMLTEDRSLGYEVRGFVDDQDGIGGDSKLRQLGTMNETLQAVHRTGATGVIIAATAMDLGTSNRLIRELTEHGIHVELSSTLRDIASYRLTVRPLGRFPVVYVEPVPRTGWRMLAKRSLDVCLAAGVLIVTSPILLASAIAIKLTTRGPIFFRQERVGRNGVKFDVIKFRTMVADAEEQLIDLREHNEVDGPLFKMRNDPRVTPVGRKLRKFSIDELPQLWNVLRNEMSMVGPRPALPSEVAMWAEALHGRLRVKPGITGMWQVSGRSTSTFEDYERLDLYYVDNWSLTTDLAIVAKTIPAVLSSRGAY